MLNQFSRTELLFGSEAITRLQNAHVAVFGIGGVGGYTVEALAREDGVDVGLEVDRLLGGGRQLGKVERGGGRRDSRAAFLELGQHPFRLGQVALARMRRTQHARRIRLYLRRDHRAQRFARAFPGRPRLGQRPLGRRVDEIVHRLDHGGEQRLFRRIMPIEALTRQVRLRRHRLHARPAIAVAAEDGQRRIEDAGAGTVLGRQGRHATNWTIMTLIVNNVRA